MFMLLMCSCSDSNRIFVCSDVNISTWLISQYPSTNRVSHIFLSIDACRVLACFWFYSILVVLFHYVLHCQILLALPPSVLSLSSPFPFHANFLFYAFWQIILEVHLASCMFGSHWLSSPHVWDNLLQIWTGNYLSFGSDYYTSGLYQSDPLASPNGLFWFMSNYWSMCPWSPSFYCITTVCPVVRKGKFTCTSASLFHRHCLFVNAVWLSSSLSHNKGGVLNVSSMPLHGLLNSSVAKTGSPRADWYWYYLQQIHIYVNTIFIAFFHGSLDQLYAHFCLSFT